jgi:hypothetical protein
MVSRIIIDIYGCGYGLKYSKINVYIIYSGKTIKFPKGNKKKLFIHLLRKFANIKLLSKDYTNIKFECYTPDKLITIMETILKIDNIKKKHVEKWEKMSLNELYSDIISMAVEQKIKES